MLLTGVGAAVATLTYLAATVAAASSWSISDATVSVQTKGSGVGSGLKEKLASGSALSKAVDLGSSDTLKIILTTQEGGTAKRPHQAFLSLQDPSTGLETSFAFAVKETGKGKIDLTHKDIPTQLLVSEKPLKASLVIASFGSSAPYKSKAFDLSVKHDSGAPIPSLPEKPLRYGKLPEIHHVFRADPKSPPKIITLFFTTAVIVALPALFIAWLALGANINHVSKAMRNAPISHTLYISAILAMEGIFFSYYTSWNLFQTLPAAFVVGSVIFVSGSKALTEVQERRLGGLR